MAIIPKESLQNTINTMGTLLGVHSFLPWTPGFTRYPQSWGSECRASPFECYRRVWLPSWSRAKPSTWCLEQQWWGGIEDGEIWRSWVMMCKSAYVIKHANTWRIEETLELSSAICRGHGTKYQTCSRMKNMGVCVFFEQGVSAGTRRETHS